MPKPRRKGKTETLSVSVSPRTKARLRRAAARAYGGNVSALIEAIAIEADRQDALDSLLHRVAPADDDAYAVFIKEMAGPKRKRASRRIVRPPASHVDDDLFDRAFAALCRARKRAEEVARQTDTYLIEAVDGKPVRVRPPAAEASAVATKARE